MNLLAIDSASSILSVAIALTLQNKEEEILYTEIEAGTRHSEIVMDCIDSLMKKASLKPEDLNGIICMGGPGSFTGLRIGFSIAKGLALSLSIPFATIPTLDCMAYSHQRCHFSAVLAAIEARKNAWFFSLYRGTKPLKPGFSAEMPRQLYKVNIPVDATSAQIAAEIEACKELDTEFPAAKIILTGTGAASLYDSMPQETRKNLVLDSKKRGYAREQLAIAKTMNLLDNDNTVLLYSGPEYIRKTDAELNLGKKT